MPPCTTKRRTTTNLKAKNNQNCQKIKLYGSPTTKELKKLSPRLLGGVEMEDGQPSGGTIGKAEDLAGKVGLAEQETKDSKLRVLAKMEA